MLKSVGTIRLIDPSLGNSKLTGHCTALETPISWNQVGQQGLPGATGATGATGAAGSSDVWDSGNHVGQDIDANTLVTEASVSLSAGSYFVIGSGSFAINGAAANSANLAVYSCFLDAPGNQDFGDGSGVSDESSGVFEAQVTEQGAVTLTSPGTVTLDCKSSQDNTFSTSPRLDAIKVGAVH